MPNIDRHLAEDIGVGLSGPGRSEPVSGIRPSFPTLTSEVGALPNEPEDDAVFRCFGCSARVLAVCVPPAALSRVWLEPKHAYVLGLLDGATAICDVLDASALPRFETLCALEELVMLAVVA